MQIEHHRAVDLRDFRLRSSFGMPYIYTLYTYTYTFTQACLVGVKQMVFMNASDTEIY